MGNRTIRLHFQENRCFIEFNRPDLDNAINREMIDECGEALDLCVARQVKVVVLQGAGKTFCSGADFDELSRADGRSPEKADGERLYRLWTRMTEEAFITISLVKGKVTGGGMGFVAASDVVIAEPLASFALPELLFGLFPACVLPFLIRRVGFQRAHYLALTTKPISAEVATNWGIVDDYGSDSDDLLRRQLLRMDHFSRTAIQRYKRYSSNLWRQIRDLESHAVAANREAFADHNNKLAIADYVARGVFPWESERVKE